MYQNPTFLFQFNRPQNQLEPTKVAWGAAPDPMEGRRQTLELLCAGVLGLYECIRLMKPSELLHPHSGTANAELATLMPT